MILLTVGTQLPFDRLIRYLDEVAPSLGEPVFGQIGQTAYKPANFEYHETIAPGEFDRVFRSARVILAHAGIGTILAAQKHGKPIVLLPRRAEFGEHRNDHQLATCAQLAGRPGIMIADELVDIPRLLAAELQPASDGDLQRKRSEFTTNLRAAICGLLDGLAVPPPTATGGYKEL